MDISVIICTYNRAENLPDSIAHLERQRDMDDIDWEVVVVDNNSSDSTREVVTELAGKSTIRVRYLFQPEQGASNARNLGIQETDSPFLVFIDDDILVSERWLRPFHDTLVQEDCDVAGGRIHLHLQSPLPPWISEDMRGFLGHQDFGAEPFRMDGATQYPFAGNMALRRDVFDRAGVFNAKLGKKGSGEGRKALFKGAEKEFFDRVHAAGCSFCYQPQALVYHRILPFQLRKRYFLNVHYNAGQQKARFDGNDYPRTIGGVPLFVIPQTLRAWWRYGMQALTRGPDAAFRQRMTAAHFMGTISGYRMRHNESRG